MKELSVEQKAKRYDETLVKESKLRVQNPFDTVSQMMEYLFPELAESDDEGIRKSLIDYFSRFKSSDMWNESFSFGDVVSWVEKQAKPTDINPSEFDLRLNKLLKQFETLPKEELASSLSFYLNVVQNDGTYREENQGEQNLIMAKSPQLGEQKPADKVEPKFKVGDWIITNKNHIWYVDETPETTPYLYRLINQYGKVEVTEFETVDEKARLWTIKDAKSGDVLRIRNLTFIFHEITNNNACHKDAVVAYCSYEDNDDSFGICGPDCITDLEIITPATKEQRDLLFQKMKEAGYEWDAEKKELKKIGQKPVEWTQDNVEELTEFENVMMHIGGSFFGEHQGLDPNDTACVKEQAQYLLELAQKPAWSEEDENGLGDALWAIKQARTIAKDENDMGNLWCAECWLKSLKDRVLPKQELNDEDIAAISRVIPIVKWAAYSDHSHPILNDAGATELIERLKHLKDRCCPQKQWKPSDEQMKALNEVLYFAANHRNLP